MSVLNSQPAPQVQEQEFFFDDTDTAPQELMASGMEDALSDDEFSDGLVTCETCGNVWDVSKPSK